MKNQISNQLLQGNEAVVEGALYAGCNFFGGYPITPSTEIAELLSYKLPQRGGVFIQMEDEIASLASVIGASIAGAKAMTATSGPGFSLMQEHIGYAYMTETPCVIVNVMRGGPSTGLPTKTSQQDLMQARYGTHGDYNPVVLVPSSVSESFEHTVKAFNLAESLMTPVIVLLDETIGHMREKIELPPNPPIEVINRRMPELPAEWYKPYRITPSGLTYRPPFGKGYRYHMTGLTHDEFGFPTGVTSEIKSKLDKLKRKINAGKSILNFYREEYTSDATQLIVAVGSAARISRQVLREARKHRMKLGLFQPLILWPFPKDRAQKLFSNVRNIFVIEHNQGQLYEVIRSLAPSRVKVFSINRYDGNTVSTEEVIEQIRKEQ